MTNGSKPTIATLSRDVTVLQTEVSIIRDDINELTRKFDDLQDRLFQRPSWTVATIITVLTALSTGLIGGILAVALH